MEQPTVLITGASSGIGMELAALFAAQGHPLVLLARSQPALEQIAQDLRSRFKVSAHVLVADLCQHHAAAHIASELQQRSLTVDILVNNAGFGLLGAVAELDAARQMDMIQVNIAALTQLTRLLLPGMLQRQVARTASNAFGGVLNVASTAAFQAGPNMAVYYATKAYVLSFTEALHEELAHTGLHVSCLCPGPTHTGFSAVAKMEHSLLFKLGAQSAAEVAKVGHVAFQRNQTIAVSGWRNRLLAHATKLTPRFLTRKIAMALNR